MLFRSLQYEESAYPRLGIFGLNPYEATVFDMGRYHLLVDSLDDPALDEKLKDLRNQAPNQKLFKPISPSERRLFIEHPKTGKLLPNPEVARLQSTFFLANTGTELTIEIDLIETVIPVNQLVDGFGTALFRVGESVMIGTYESAKILSIDKKNKTLTLERGYVRPASYHTAGTRIASHIEFRPGTWVMNMTSECPRQIVFGINQPVNYAQYYLALATGKLDILYPEGYYSADNLQRLDIYDGIALDLIEDRLFDASWSAGVVDFTLQLREITGDLPIIRNNSQSVNQLDYQGQIFETFGWENATSEWWHRLVVKGAPGEVEPQSAYLEGFKEATVLFKVYEDERFPVADLAPVKMPEKLNYQRMRFGLASALMGNGYFSYELNANGHGGLGQLWFDEYDLGIGKRGYLGYPKGEPKKISDYVYSRKFTKGIAVVNASDKEQEIDLEGYYQHIKGKQDAERNSGEIVQQVTLQPWDGVILLKLPLLYQWTYNAQQFEE